MDPLSLAIAGALVAGAATAVSESATAALPTLWRRIRERFSGRTPTPATEAEIATALHEEFTRDPSFRRECEDLWNRASTGTVTNTFHGEAKNVVQTHEVNGGLTMQ
ncbi:hypothetical protein ACGFYZ_11385 [Streptomyces sp. NPDC048330]|uniref:hypothetical protein n=1 Tax=Streptomyces sp. NPDC048330 TaxID=3365533 RepID=UPI003714A0CD